MPPFFTQVHRRHSREADPSIRHMQETDLIDFHFEPISQPIPVKVVIPKRGSALAPLCKIVERVPASRMKNRRRRHDKCRTPYDYGDEFGF